MTGQDVDDASAEETRQESDPDRRILQLDDVNALYGRSHVLHDVSLEVREGEIVALLGRNGAGKTTTLRTIVGLLSPENGSISYHGQRIDELAPDEIRREGIAWVPEDRRVYPSLTVAENLSVAAHSGDARAVESMYDRFPRLDERREQPAGSLSGGEQQMLAIARGLVGSETDLLLFDEPSEGLAPQLVEEIAATLDELNREGKAVLLVEQNAEMALELADRVYIIETGRIVHERAADDLGNERALLERYIGVPDV